MVNITTFFPQLKAVGNGFFFNIVEWILKRSTTFWGKFTPLGQELL